MRERFSIFSTSLWGLCIHVIKFLSFYSVFFPFFHNSLLHFLLVLESNNTVNSSPPWSFIFFLLLLAILFSHFLFSSWNSIFYRDIKWFLNWSNENSWLFLSLDHFHYTRYVFRPISIISCILLKYFQIYAFVFSSSPNFLPLSLLFMCHNILWTILLFLNIFQIYFNGSFLLLFCLWNPIEWQIYLTYYILSLFILTTLLF